MLTNQYFLELHARHLLEEARAARARAALAPPRTPRVRPAMAGVVAAARALYARATRPLRLAAGAR